MAIQAFFEARSTPCIAVALKRQAPSGLRPPPRSPGLIRFTLGVTQVGYDQTHFCIGVNWLDFSITLYPCSGNNPEQLTELSLNRRDEGWNLVFHDLPGFLPSLMHLCGNGCALLILR